MSVPVVPPPGALPLPAEIVTLGVLHTAASFAFLFLANLAIGLPVMTLAAEALGAGRGDTSLRRVAVWLARRTPGTITLAIVSAVPLLLLGTARHGEIVLPPMLQMGWFWMSAGPLLMVGCGFSFWVALRRRGTEPSTLRPFLPDIVESYILAFRRRGLERPGMILTAIIALSMLAVGFIFAAHSVLVVNPDLWGPGAPEPTGTVLPLKDPQLLPRLVYLLLGSLAITGFTVAWHGSGRVRGGDYGYGNTAFRYGILWLAIPVGLKALASVWFVYSLPADVTAEFLGRSGSYTAVFWIGVAMDAAVLVLSIGAMVAAERRAPLAAGLVGLLVSTGCAVAVHQRVREILVDLPFATASRAVDVQPDVLALFVVVAATGIALLAYMAWVAAGSTKSSIV